MVLPPSSWYDFKDAAVHQKTKTKQQLFTQFSWPEMDTRGTVDC